MPGKKPGNFIVQETEVYVLDEFMRKAVDDHRLYPSHISLFVALFYLWKEQGYADGLNMRRDELMKRSKIVGRGTYQRCLRELDKGGYIKYIPTFNRFANSLVFIIYERTLAV